LIDRDAFSFGKLANLLVQRFRKSQTDRAHGKTSIKRRKSRGVMVRTPNRSMPEKSR
jgi:hypothetical protein